jgi:hypothetical protein
MANYYAQKSRCIAATAFLIFDEFPTYNGAYYPLKVKKLVPVLSRDKSLPLGMNILSYGRRTRHQYV